MRIVGLIIACVFFLVSIVLAYQIFIQKKKGIGAYILLGITLFISLYMFYLVITNGLIPIDYNIPRST